MGAMTLALTMGGLSALSSIASTSHIIRNQIIEIHRKNDKQILFAFRNHFLLLFGVVTVHPKKFQ